MTNIKQKLLYYRKALIVVTGSVVAICAHYDLTWGDHTGDVLFVYDTVLTPLAVWYFKNGPKPEGTD